MLDTYLHKDSKKSDREWWNVPHIQKYMKYLVESLGTYCAIYGGLINVRGQRVAGIGR